MPWQNRRRKWLALARGPKTADGRGDGVVTDYAAAERWFSAAAEQGNMEALREMGTMYRFGQVP